MGYKGISSAFVQHAPRRRRTGCPFPPPSTATPTPRESPRRAAAQVDGVPCTPANILALLVRARRGGARLRVCAWRAWEAGCGMRRLEREREGEGEGEGEGERGGREGGREGGERERGGGGGGGGEGAITCG